MRISILSVLAAGAVATPAFAQTTAPSSPPTTPPPAVTMPERTPSMTSPMKMTDAEAKQWIDKVIYSSDGKNVGEVGALQRDATGAVTELHADVGGFLGIGETRVRVQPAQFRLEGDRVVLQMTADQVKALPKVTK